jgi:hypothetical protein
LQRFLPAAGGEHRIPVDESTTKLLQIGDFIVDYQDLMFFHAGDGILASSTPEKQTIANGTILIVPSRSVRVYRRVPVTGRCMGRFAGRLDLDAPGNGDLTASQEFPG